MVSVEFMSQLQAKVLYRAFKFLFSKPQPLLQLLGQHLIYFTDIFIHEFYHDACFSSRQKYYHCYHFLLPQYRYFAFDLQSHAITDFTVTKKVLTAGSYNCLTFSLSKLTVFVKSCAITPQYNNSLIRDGWCQD